MRYKIISEIHGKSFEYLTFEAFSCALSIQIFGCVPKLIVPLEEDCYDFVYKISFVD